MADSKRRRIRSPRMLAQLWDEYKQDCDHQQTLVSEFSAKNSEFVTEALPRSCTYTIEGFCVYLGLARSAFYDTYANDPRYSDMVTRMREECEVDARRKFELQVLPSQLAGLWMSRHGYTTKTDAGAESVAQALEGAARILGEIPSAIEGPR